MMTNRDWIKVGMAASYLFNGILQEDWNILMVHPAVREFMHRTPDGIKEVKLYRVSEYLYIGYNEFTNCLLIQDLRVGA